MKMLQIVRPLMPGSPYFAELQRIYVQSFPVEERRSIESLIEKHNSGALTAYVAVDDFDRVAAIATFWDLDGVGYVEHLAVSRDMRGCGIGSELMCRLTEIAAGMPLVVEVELPHTCSDARRRVEFYRRLGFKPFPDFNYIQPPYSPDLSPVPLMLMVANAADANPDLNKIKNKLYNYVYGI